MNIYEIDQQIASLIDLETGEILDFETVSRLEMERDRKIENLALWYKNVCAEAAAIKAESDALIKRSQSLLSLSERLKSYLGMILDGVKFSTPRCSISFRKTSSLDVPNPEDVIEWAKKNGYISCIRQKPPELDKKSVSELLKDGIEIPGAEIKVKKSITIK